MPSDGADTILHALRERAKELRCLYAVHELVDQPDASADEVCRQLLHVIPPGWQYPGTCWARVTLEGVVYEPPGAAATPWVQQADIVAGGEPIGRIEVFYTTPTPPADEGPFLREERKLLETIARRLAQFAVHRRALTRPEADHWRWRLHMLERLAAQTDAARFGIRAMYVFGSTKNATAGPGSDIDVIVHLEASVEQRHDLGLWREGWSRCLAEMNDLRTGYRTDGLLDVHYVTDEDIARRTSYAAKIGAVTDAARQLRLRASP